jgi:hypothetical protein
MDTGDLAADAEGSQAADTGVAALMPAGSEDCAEGSTRGRERKIERAGVRDDALIPTLC